MIISAGKQERGELHFLYDSVTVFNKYLFPQGLYCISVNCMDNAEAQFTTALRVSAVFHSFLQLHTDELNHHTCDKTAHAAGLPP